MLSKSQLMPSLEQMTPTLACTSLKSEIEIQEAAEKLQASQI